MHARQLGDGNITFEEKRKNSLHHLKKRGATYANYANKSPGTGSREISRFQFRALFLLYALLFSGFRVTGFRLPQVWRLAWSSLRFSFLESFS